MNAIVLDSHAKVNLTLDVLNRRQDGYHEIRSVMQSITLADRLILTKCASGINLKTNFQFVAPNQNLVWKAATLFLETLKIEQGVTIDLTKNIPIAAGLGGGSGNAAAVLWGLNELFESHLSLAELQKLGKQLGADVPFCLEGGTMLAEGIGEKLTTLPAAPQYFLVLIKPNQSVSTATVYQSLTSEMFQDRFSTPLIEALQTEAPIHQFLGNCLEQVTSSLIGEIDIWKIRLLENGAKASLMSGSGPTIIGFFTSENLATQFCQQWGQSCWMTITSLCDRGLSVVEG